MASPNWSLVLKTGPVECLALQQPERDFHLVEPVGRSWREVKLDAALEPR